MPEWLNSEWAKQLWQTVYPHLPTLGAALGVLIFGWLAAFVVQRIVFAALKRTTIDDKVADLIGFESGGDDDERVETAISKTVYYVMLAFVFVAFFDQLKIEAVTRPVLTALDGLTGAIPNVLKAVVIGVIGFLLATLVRRGIILLLDKTGIVAKMEKLAGSEAPPEAKTDGKKKKKKKRAEEPLGQTLGDVAYWFVIIVTAIPVLEALKVGALAAPLSAAFAMVTTYLPKIVAAAVLILVGYVLARVARGVITGIFDKVGLDRAVSRLGFGAVLRGQSLGAIFGTLAMAFILLHFAISAVGRLDIAEISVPLGMMLTQIYSYLPKLLVGGLLLAIGVVLARIAGNVAARLLAAVGFNTMMVHIGLFKEVSEAAKKQEKDSKKIVDDRVHGDNRTKDGDEPDDLLAQSGTDGLSTPADVAGLVVASIVVLLFLRQALATMQLEGLAGMLDTLIAFLPNVMVAAVVLGAGMWAGAWAHQRVDQLTRSSQDRLLKALGSVAHVSIVSFAAMIALQQLGVGRQLIAIAFALLLGAICLALALAFGLGGREVAGRIVQKEYDRRQRR